eukprot:Clim_evm29s199 gene=Clim_evmTU29s199
MAGMSCSQKKSVPIPVSRPNVRPVKSPRGMAPVGVQMIKDFDSYEQGNQSPLLLSPGRNALEGSWTKRNSTQELLQLAAVLHLDVDSGLSMGAPTRDVMNKKTMDEHIVRTKLAEGAHSKINKDDKKMMIVMVGLPARGKSFISKKLRRYLAWRGYKVEVFNCGTRRRLKLKKDSGIDLAAMPVHQASFFDPSNLEAKQKRDQIAMDTLEAGLEYLFQKNGKIAIMDATNSNPDRRRMIWNRCQKESNLDVLFLEILCDDQEQINFNVCLKANSPDYRHMAPEEAKADFLERLRHYEAAYQTVHESENPAMRYIKIMNVGQKVDTYQVEGYLGSQIVFFLMNTHLKPRPIYLLRSGETQYRRSGKLGGDSSLTARGVLYARMLGGILDDELEGQRKVVCMTSSMRRSTQTAEYFPSHWCYKQFNILNERYLGAADGRSPDYIAETMPEEIHLQHADPLNYRYPQGGESYVDLMERVRPIIVELEREDRPVVVIAHQDVLAVIYAYFRDIPVAKIPDIRIPKNTVHRLTPSHGGVLHHHQDLSSSLHNQWNSTVASPGGSDPALDLTFGRSLSSESPRLLIPYTNWTEPSSQYLSKSLAHQSGADSAAEISMMATADRKLKEGAGRRYPCRWGGCDRIFPSPGILCHHVEEEHVFGEDLSASTTSSKSEPATP